VSTGTFGGVVAQPTIKDRVENRRIKLSLINMCDSPLPLFNYHFLQIQQKYVIIHAPWKTTPARQRSTSAQHCHFI
jgi:hypothetical protein